MKKTTILSLAVTALLFLGTGLGARAQYVTLGTGNESGYYPVKTIYHHNISQQIYLASELGNHAKNIHAMALHQKAVNEDMAVQRRHFKVYLSHTTKSSFTSANGWETNISSSDMVYDDYFYLSTRDEWTSIDFTTPFQYNGTDNLVITIVDEMDNSIAYESGHMFYCTSCPNMMCLVNFSDDANYSISYFGNPSNTDPSSNRPNVRFYTTPSVTSTLPVIEIGDGTTSTSSQNLPTTALYNNSCSEQIFTNAELGGTGTKIYGVQFYQMPNTSADEKHRNVKVYLSSTSYTYYSTSTSWTTVLSSELNYNGSYVLDDDEGWRTIWFDTPKTIGSINYALVMVDSNDNYQGGHYFATHSTDDNSSIYARSDNTSYNASSMSSVTGTLVEYRNNVRFITDVPEPLACSIEGPDNGLTGNALTFTADGPSDATYSWTFPSATPSSATGETATTTWSVAGTYTVTLNATRGSESVSATKSVTISSCSGIEQLPFNEGFEDGFGCWETVDLDGDGNNWMLTSDAINIDNLFSNYNHSGDDAVTSASYADGSILTPDNWLISPALALPNGNIKVTWWESGQHDSDYADHYGLYISANGGTNPSDFVPLWEGEPEQPMTWVEREVSLNSYAGQTVHIAFRHYNISDMYYLILDDIAVTTGAGIDNSDELAVELYPNPTTGLININVQDLQNVEVLDVTGRTIVTTSENKIDLTGSPAGIYTLRIQTANGTAVRRVVLN